MGNKSTCAFIAIVGKPNVGKSSLLNMLLDEDKAIVSEYAGTTRDIVEGKLNIGNITLNLIDTAGIRESEDFVEQIGINKAKEVLMKAELVLLVLDNNEINDFDKELLEITRNKKRIIILNKMDLNNKPNIDEEHICCAIGDPKHQEGVDKKKEWIKSKLKDGHIFRKLNARGKTFIEYLANELAFYMRRKNIGIGGAY